MHSDAVSSSGELFDGRYRLQDELGRGGMGVVHRAWDVRLDRPVAIKILRNSSGSARFRVEGQTLSRLNHPGLVTVHDAGVADEEPYLVMELVEGGPLTRRIRGRRPGLAEVLAIGTELAEALAHVHAHRIVHRDIKPANILVGRDGRVKLADFGVARLLDGLTRHTDTGMIMGTAGYLSPEQVRGEAVTGASDIYSLGLVLIEALTGSPEFTGPWPEAAVARLTRSPWIDPAWPAPLAGLLAGMTAADPASRPTADMVAVALGSMSAEEWTVPGTAPVPIADDTRSTDPVTSDLVTSGLVALPGSSPDPVPSPSRWPDVFRGRAQHGLLVAAALLIPILLLGLDVAQVGALGPADTAQATVATSRGTAPATTKKTTVDGVSTRVASASFTAPKTSSSKSSGSARQKVVRKKSTTSHTYHWKARAPEAPHGPGHRPPAGPGPAAGGPGQPRH